MKNLIERPEEVRTKQDLVGGNYTNLVVLKLVGYIPEGNRKIQVYECQCSCGNNCLVRKKDLKSGRQKSCGCLKVETTRKIGKNNLLSEHKSSKNTLYNSYYQRARIKGLVFKINKEQFIHLTSKVCHYCGVNPYKDAANFNKDIKSHYFYNGLDRVDNTKGYEENNIVTCCEICNKAKRDLSQEDFLEWIGRLTSYQSEVKRNVLEDISIN